MQKPTREYLKKTIKEEGRDISVALAVTNI